MNKYKTDIGTCKNIITEFVNSKYLNGDINKLVSFSFSDLCDDNYFGCKGRFFDEDDTDLARAIMYLIWFNKIPDLTFDDIGTGKNYRGDTLNTYNTLFGRNNQYKKYITNSSLENTILEFKKKYVTLGNFMLMPNITKQGKKSINCYRGVGSGWYDYFDIFLNELNKCLNKFDGNDAVLSMLIEENDFYFKKINNIKIFCEVNYLDSYLLNKKVKILFEPYIYHWKYKSIDEKIQKLYSEFVKKYISQVNDIINFRSKKMFKDLLIKMY